MYNSCALRAASTFGVDGFTATLHQLIQLTVQAINLRHLQHLAGQVQPPAALNTRQLPAKSSGCALITTQLQGSTLVGNQGGQPVTQRRCALTVTLIITPSPSSCAPATNEVLRGEQTPMVA
jgi:hypothetical protein